MELSQNLPSGVFNVLLALTTLICFAGSVRSTRIVIRNNCSHTVWAAANPGGGKELRQGDTWTLPNVTGRGRIWGRTNCAGFGHDGLGGRCESGDCGGRLECETDGRAPNTVAEYSVGDRETDGFYISLVEGFNIPMEFGAAPSSTEVCPQATRCAADVNAPCPMELRDPGGCNNPCTVFQNNQFCCTSTGSSTSCGPTSYSKFFEDLCPEAATYPNDINAKRSTCQTGIEYSVVFCPSETESDSSTQLYSPVFEIQNNCSYPVWAAAVPGGSKRLDSGESWFTNRDKGTAGGARIWGRTNCSFDAAGRGKCETGDCGGLLECKGYSKQPVTLAEYALNQLSNLDFFDISLVDVFNLPMEFVPTSNGCVRGPRCAADLSRECPKVLRAPGGCHNPCTVFKTAEYCCFIGSTCGPTSFSRYFKDRCPDSYSYPRDDLTSTFTCPGGTYYKIVFCP